MKRMDGTAASAGPRRSRGWSLLETLVAMVVLGAGVTLYMGVQNRNSGITRGNSDLYRAGQILDKHLEALRVRIAQDTLANWPPLDTTYQDALYERVTVERKVSEAYSPKDGVLLPSVRTIHMQLSWGTGHLDTLRVTTYVSKRF